jgi:hypothetical protein
MQSVERRIVLRKIRPKMAAATLFSVQRRPDQITGDDDHVGKFDCRLAMRRVSHAFDPLDDRQRFTQSSPVSNDRHMLAHHTL